MTATPSTVDGGGGLTTAEVADRVARGQVNVVARGSSRSVTEIVRANVFTLFNLIVGTLFVIMLVVGPVQDALFGIVAIANTLIGIVQEIRAKQSLDRLALVGRPRITVVRDGREQEIEPDTVVVDDLVRLSSGAQIVVDGEVVEAEAFEVDESLLIGESDAVTKRPGDEVLSGSFAVAGRGTMRVTKVGADA
ncbi:MAG: cation-translocating P-type ATPase, partial [Ilumatobacteraceae bacterium]